MGGIPWLPLPLPLPLHVEISFMGDMPWLPLPLPLDIEFLGFGRQSSLKVLKVPQLPKIKNKKYQF